MTRRAPLMKKCRVGNRSEPVSPEAQLRKGTEPLDDDSLFAFVVDYQERSQDWPTLRVVAEHFSVTQGFAEEAIEAFDSSGRRGLDLIVAYRLGSGVAEIKGRGNYKVEAWDDGDEE
jgi:hypothetical protein